LRKQFEIPFKFLFKFLIRHTPVAKARYNAYNANTSTAPLHSPAGHGALEEREHGLDQAGYGHHAGNERVCQELQEELVVQQAYAVHNLQQQQRSARILVSAC
jgi:hypothetical protein